MLKKIFRLLNCIIINNIRLVILKLFHFKKFNFHPINLISPLVSVDIQGKGKIILERKCNIYPFTVLAVREMGMLKISEDAFINRNCQIVAHNKIIIGKNVSIGPNVVIMDHDHQFGKDGIVDKNFASSSIIIEDNVWIGANTVILKGTRIGKNSIIGAGSFIKGNIEDQTILVQKRTNTFRKNV